MMRNWMGLVILFGLVLSLTIIVRARFHDSNVPAGYRDRSGSEILMVFFAAQSCAFCDDPRLPSLLDRARVSLTARAAAHGMTFTTTAVGVDQTAEEGITSLRRFGSWDEMIVGRKWQSVGVMEYIWEGVRGRAGVPQILVLKRTLQGPPNSVYMVVNQAVLARAVGLAEIIRWIDNGLPLAMEGPRREATVRK